MRFERLTERVALQQLGSAQDALGQPISAWTTVATVWADVKHLNGAETIRAGADVSTVQASIRIRYGTTVDAGMRVMHGSTVYEIKAVLPNKKEFIDLVCEVIHA
jgi:SPP1 family predicted phage head-tail adaptor